MSRKGSWWFALVLTALLLSVAGARASGTLSMYEGRHFLLGFMQNEAYRYNTESFSLRMYITTKRPSRVRVTSPGGTFRTYTIKGDTVLTLNVDPALEVRQSEIPVAAALELTSNEPIAVYAFSSLTLSSDAYAVIPTDAWDREYFALCLSNDSYNLPARSPTSSLDSALKKMPRLGEFMIIAAEDSTTICYTPTAPTRAGVPAGTTAKAVLNKGECFLVMSEPAPKNFNDLSGSYITSDKPVGVLSGHMRTSIPHFPDAMAGEYDTKDHLVEMLPPVGVWGTEHVSVPFDVCAEGDYFRVVAAFDSTTLVMESEEQQHTVVLMRGETVEFEYVASPAVWTADRPVMIGQYMYSDILDPFTSADPCYVILPPLDRFVRRLIFQAPSTVDTSQFDLYNVQIICTAEALGSLAMNAVPVTAIAPEILEQTVQTTGLHWAIIRVHPGRVYTLATTTGSFSGIIFAHGPADSYGVPLGTSFTGTAHDTLAPIINVSEQCGTVQGTVAEHAAEASGVYEVYVDAAGTENYAVDIDPITTPVASVSFTAQPISLYKNARLALVAVDRAGNETRLTRTYTAPSIVCDSTVSIPDLPAGSTLCEPVELVNDGTSSFVVSGLHIMSDSRASLRNKPILPATLAPGESLLFEICYTATDDTAALRAQVLIQYGCGLQRWIHIGHTSGNPALAATGHEFGDVLVGDTVCAAVAVVNTGATSILLTGLADLALPEIFLIDTAGVFPHELGVGDTLLLRVCFAPLQPQPYRDTAQADNAYRLPNAAVLSGRGVAPDIVATSVDWRERRVGTTHDSTVTLHNRGTATALLTLEPRASEPDAVLSYEWLHFFPLLLPPDSSVVLPVRFTPVDRTEYSTTLSVRVDWKFHQPVSIALLGRGTLPAIETVDIVFDTIAVGASTDTTVVTLLSRGNELLTIDTLWFADGDIASFTAPSEAWKPRSIPVGDGSAFALQFRPMRSGLHTARVAVLHDARANYGRDTAYFIVSGHAVAHDTVDVVISLPEVGPLFACHTNSLTPVFDNTGSTIAFVVDSVVVHTSTTDTTLLVPEGTTVAAGGTLLLPAVSITPAEQGLFTLQLQVYYHKADTKEPSPRKSTVETTLFIQRSRLTVTPPAAQQVSPWDTPAIRLQGTISGAQELHGSFALRLGYNFSSFRPLHDTATIAIVHNGDSDTLLLRARVEEDREGVTVLPETFHVYLPARWSLSLPLFVFLDTLEAPDITVDIASNGCLTGDSTLLPVLLTGVCSYPNRSVRYLPVVTTRIRPNPAAEDVHVDISLPDDNVVSIALVDALGRRFEIAEKMYLKKGKYSYKLSLAGFNSGIYSLVVTCSNSVSQHHFLINK